MAGHRCTVVFTTTSTFDKRTAYPRSVYRGLAANDSLAFRLCFTYRSFYLTYVRGYNADLRVFECAKCDNSKPALTRTPDPNRSTTVFDLRINPHFTRSNIRTTAAHFTSVLRLLLAPGCTHHLRVLQIIIPPRLAELCDRSLCHSFVLSVTEITPGSPLSRQCEIP